MNVIHSLRHIVLGFLLFAAAASFGQSTKSDSVFYFRGRTVDSEEMSALYNVHIINQTLQTGTVAAFDGSFRLAARVGDTVTFSLVGYKNLKVKVKEEHKNSSYPVIIPMHFALTEMEAVTIYGKTFEQFRQDFKALNINPKSMSEIVIKSINEDLGVLGAASATGFTGPIQFLYDRLNKTESLRRKLQNNRNKMPFPADAYEGFPTHPSGISDTTNIQL